MNAEDEWRGILADDEVILWQGRPEPGIRLEFKSAFEPLFFAAFTGFSIFWMSMASRAGGVFWMFGLIFFFTGFQSLVGQHFWKAFRRNRSFYTLTNSRALIATDLPFQGRRLTSHGINSNAAIEMTGTGPYDVVFDRDRHKSNGGKTTLRAISFERISEGPKVYGLLRNIQTEIARKDPAESASED